ncbi:hypothetical protein IPV27_28735, partial [Acidovorax sp. SD340]|nr:hypothetical protein [Acidovorax sp. SD340]
MRIESSTLQMQSQHVATRMHSQTSRLEMWVGDRPASTPLARQAPPLQISTAARLAQAAHAPHGATTSVEPLPERARDEGLTPQLAMIRD